MNWIIVPLPHRSQVHDPLDAPEQGAWWTPSGNLVKLHVSCLYFQSSIWSFVWFLGYFSGIIDFSHARWAGWETRDTLQSRGDVNESWRSRLGCFQQQGQKGSLTLQPVDHGSQGIFAVANTTVSGWKVGRYHTRFTAEFDLSNLSKAYLASAFCTPEKKGPCSRKGRTIWNCKSIARTLFLPNISHWSLLLWQATTVSQFLRPKLDHRKGRFQMECKALVCWLRNQRREQYMFFAGTHPVLKAIGALETLFQKSQNVWNIKQTWHLPLSLDNTCNVQAEGQTYLFVTGSTCTKWVWVCSCWVCERGCTVGFRSMHFGFRIKSLWTWNPFRDIETLPVLFMERNVMHCPRRFQI